ncbi:MAG TPA: DUF1499 domain-containing protein [Candidatus Binataceae bacterium]|nr:DUF1499 domain-containing protein [Candidatus Binataceae bacterium]
MAAAWLGYFDALIALALVVAGPLAAHLNFIDPMLGLQIMLFGLLFGLLTLVLGVIGYFQTRHFGTQQRAVFALTVGGAISAGAVLLFLVAMRYPAINDLTTDYTNPPQFVHAAELPANSSRSLAYNQAWMEPRQRRGYPGLGPLATLLPPPAAFAQVEAMARAMPDWQVTYANPATRTLEAVATSAVFGFHDDVVIEVRAQGSGSLIEMRSRGREGIGDFGRNNRHIEDFFARLKTRLTRA